MSMIANLLRVTGEELKMYLNDSSLLEEKLDRVYEQEEDETLIDLDKAWEGILFLLTGQGLADLVESNHPLAKAILGGQTIDENQDLGYGPALYLTPEQVQDINRQIATVSNEEIAAAYNPNAMMEQGIYPEVWDEEALEYLMEYVDVLRNTYAVAAKNNEAIIAFIN